MERAVVDLERSLIGTTRQLDRLAVAATDNRAVVSDYRREAVLLDPENVLDIEVVSIEQGEGEVALVVQSLGGGVSATSADPLRVYASGCVRVRVTAGVGVQGDPEPVTDGCPPIEWLPGLELVPVAPDISDWRTRRL